MSCICFVESMQHAFVLCFLDRPFSFGKVKELSLRCNIEGPFLHFSRQNILMRYILMFCFFVFLFFCFFCFFVFLFFRFFVFFVFLCFSFPLLNIECFMQHVCRCLTRSVLSLSQYVLGVCVYAQKHGENSHRPVVYVNTANHLMGATNLNPDLSLFVWNDVSVDEGSNREAEMLARKSIRQKPVLWNPFPNMVLKAA